MNLIENKLQTTYFLGLCMCVAQTQHWGCFYRVARNVKRLREPIAWLYLFASLCTEFGIGEIALRQCHFVRFSSFSSFTLLDWIVLSKWMVWIFEMDPLTCLHKCHQFFFPNSRKSLSNWFWVSFYRSTLTFDQRPYPAVTQPCLAYIWMLCSLNHSSESGVRK